MIPLTEPQKSGKSSSQAPLQGSECLLAQHHWKSIAGTHDKSSSPKGAELRAHLSNAWFVQIDLGAPSKLQSQHSGALLSLTNMGCAVLPVSAQSVCKFCSSSWTKHSGL